MTATKPDAEFQQHLKEGRFMIQRCRTSGRFFFYPRVAEPGSGDTDLEWVEVSGKGSVHATTTVRVKPPGADYNVALIELEEGPRLMSRVEGLPPEAVTIGLPVRARIHVEGDSRCIVFDPAG